MNSTSVIIVPIHKPNPSNYELISFQQCFSVFNNRQIVIVAPKGIDLKYYKDVIPSFDKIFIHPKWQSSLVAYNKLKTSRYFYNFFKQFDFLLTYELDAFVFRDELDIWCQKGYDYIGAPWFEGNDTPTPNNKLVMVGNSGFSLRNIQAVREVLKKLYYKNPQEYTTGKKNLFKAYIKTPYRWLRNKTGENYTVQRNCHLYEDVFFSEVAPREFKNFKVAPIEEAVKFSFEVNPRILFERTGGKLPMGCHAWWRYDLDFWRPHINQFGYSV